MKTHDCHSDILSELCLLIIEIVSPTCRTLDNKEKREEYAQFGIPEYWIIDFLLGIFSILTLANGTYVEKVYTKGDRIISNTFPEFF